MICERRDGLAGQFLICRTPAFAKATLLVYTFFVLVCDAREKGINVVKSKFAALVAAATLAIAPGLVACGNQQTSSSSSSEVSSSSQSSSSEVSLAVDPSIAEWGAEGATNDGSFGVLYIESRPKDTDETFATIVFKDAASGVATFYSGEFVEKDGTCTLTDTETGIVITYTTPERNAQTGEVKMSFSNNGDATLAVAKDLTAVRKNMAQAIANNSVGEAGQSSSSD